MKRLRTWIALVVATLLCAGCGGSQDRGGTVPGSSPLQTSALCDLERQSWASARTYLVAYDDLSRSEPTWVASTAGEDDLLSIVDLTSDVAVVRHPTDYVSCDGGTCRVLLVLEAGDRFYGVRRAPGGEREVIVHGSAEGDVATIFDLPSGHQRGEIAAEGWLARGGLPLSWVSDDRIAMSWGAGTFVAMVLLYDSRGDQLLSLSCDAISEDGPFVACWSPPNAPSASELQVFDLSAEPGRLRLELPPELEGADVDVRHLLFDGDGLWVLLGVEGSDLVRPVFVPLY